MTYEEILIKLRHLKEDMTERGFPNAIASLTVYTTRRSQLFLHALDGTSVFLHADDSNEDLAQSFDDAFTWIAELKSKHDLEAENLQKELAAVIEKAEKLGVDCQSVGEIVNPLREVMKQLSENILEFSPEDCKIKKETE